MKIVGPTAALPATEEDWGTEYGDLIVSIKVVENIDRAIEHINQYGSGHTEAMVGEDTESFDKFFAQVNSAGVFLNASTRFADGFRYGFGAEVGISTAKQHPRGPVGIEGLVTYKYKLIGDGHVVSDYVGTYAKEFTHKDLKLQPHSAVEGWARSDLMMQHSAVEGGARSDLMMQHSAVEGGARSDSMMQPHSSAVGGGACSAAEDETEPKQEKS